MPTVPRPTRTAGSDVAPRTPPPISEAQRAVLYTLRRRGEATAEQLALAMGLTVSAVRQHLAALTEAGLVASMPAPRRPGQRGRATSVHHVTGAADPLFPKAYGELTNQLLGYLDEESVQTVFVRRRDDRITAARHRLAVQPTFTARVRELARILDEDGYLASFEAAGRDRFLVTEHNCAILSVAREHPDACSSEIEFLRASLPDAEVERTTHMIAGAHACTYEIRRHR